MKEFNEYIDGLEIEKCVDISAKQNQLDLINKKIYRPILIF